MPTFPGLVVSGQVISSAWANGIRNALIDTYGEIYAWTAHVDANNKNLSDLGVLAFNAAGYVNSSVGIGRVPSANFDLDVYRASPFAQIQIESGGNAATGLVIKDSVRSYKLGINVDSSSIGAFMIYSFNGTRVLLQCGDSEVKLYLGGTLKTLSVDGSGFVKAT